MKNQEIANIFRKIAQILEIKGENPFRIRAYERAARNIESIPEDIEILIREDRVRNIPEAGLGERDLPAGKIRVFQEDAGGGTVFLGEDRLSTVPVGEDMKVTIGDSRDIVVTQKKMKEIRTNIRRNQKN